MTHTSLTFQSVLLALQSFQVLHLWLHDWLPLCTLNNPAAIRRQDPPRKLVLTTIIQAVPYTIGLYGSARSFSHPYPGWVVNWLWISYTLLFAGEIRAWWQPYLFGGDPARIARYQTMFGGTHTLLPMRHGFSPNTLHLLLHLTLAATLLTLAAQHFTVS